MEFCEAAGLHFSDILKMELDIDSYYSQDETELTYRFSGNINGTYDRFGEITIISDNESYKQMYGHYFDEANDIPYTEVSVHSKDIKVNPR